jgi:glucoamylase
LIDRTNAMDVSLLGLVVPLGLLPASDPRVVRGAETILRTSMVSGDPHALSRWSLQPGRSERNPNESQTQDVSSVATLWMARYLIQLGRETGQVRHWNRALAMLDSLLGRLLPLGVSMRTAARLGDPSQRQVTGTSSGAWALHSMIIETILDFSGLDYQALDRRVTLDPALPSAWPQTGQTQVFACGEVSYRLERPIGGTVHQLSLKAKLEHTVTLQVGITCPGLDELGPWQSSVPSLPQPQFDARTGRLTWSNELRAGETLRSWTWG